MDGTMDLAAIRQLEEELEYYKKENQRLTELNQWMHDLIWELYHKVKAAGL